MRKTKAEAAVTRQLVLDAALVVFSQQGYSATKLDDIAAYANLTRGAIYWHFKNKTDVYLTLVREVSTRLSDVIASVIAQGETSADILRRLLVETCGYIETDEQFRRVTELTLFKTERLPELEIGMQMKLEGIDATTRYLAELIQTGVNTGEFRRNLDPQQAAQTLTELQNGLVSNWLLSNSAYSLRASAEAAAAIYIKGIS